MEQDEASVTAANSTLLSLPAGCRGLEFQITSRAWCLSHLVFRMQEKKCYWLCSPAGTSVMVEADSMSLCGGPDRSELRTGCVAMVSSSMWRRLLISVGNMALRKRGTATRKATGRNFVGGIHSTEEQDADILLLHAVDAEPKVVGLRPTT